MASIRDTKQRIKSVTSTQQITKAMNLVAASKLGRTKNTLFDGKPFVKEVTRVMGEVIKSAAPNNKFLKNDGKGIAVIVVTSDRGLCGGYNTNISKEAETLIKDRDDEQLIIIGSKGRDYFRMRGRNILKVFTGISEKPLYEDAGSIGQIALDMYNSGEVSEVHIAFTEFINTISHNPTTRKLLPLDKDFLLKGNNEPPKDMLYEPDEEELLTYIVPKFVNTFIYAGLVESAACEQGARMTSMDAATKNGKEMIEHLTVVYNRARQTAITQEITEIVGGVNALT